MRLQGRLPHQDPVRLVLILVALLTAICFVVLFLLPNGEPDEAPAPEVHYEALSVRAYETAQLDAWLKVLPPPTTAPPETTTTRPRRTTTTTSRASRSAGAGRSGDTWSALAACESGGNPTAVSATGKYRGAFQFSLATWYSVGRTGDPISHTYEQQLDAAKDLQARSGWGQWPRCARRLGLI
jgi:hypothetical protein